MYYYLPRVGRFFNFYIIQKSQKFKKSVLFEGDIEVAKLAYCSFYEVSEAKFFKLRRLNKKQAGRSMIEMLGVLAIVGILSAGGIAGYSMAMQAHKTNALIDKVQLIAQQVRTVYKDGDYQGLDSAQKLIDAGLITDANNPFGGVFEISTSYGGSVDIKTEHNIPTNACVKILTMNYGDSSMIYGIHIHYPGKTKKFQTNNGTWPVSRDTAINSCKNDNIQVKWIFL